MKPRSWEEVVGQEPAVRLFKRALASGKLAQTYLLVGPEGTGKKTCAFLLVNYLFCSESSPCYECTNCQKLSRGVHPDLMVLDPQGENIKISQVREAENFMRFRPLEAPAKVILILSAERLTPEAANALLKSLEEPPPYVHFILTAVSTDTLLPTIVSRSQVVRFRALPPELVTKMLIERFGREPEEAQMLALLSEGSLGRALSLAEKGLLEELNRVVSAARMNDPALKLKAAEGLAQRKRDLPELIYLLKLWLWYSYLKAKGLSEYPRVFPEPAPAEAIKIISFADRILEGLERYANPELSLLALILELSCLLQG